jgi:hypothetical protein
MSENVWRCSTTEDEQMDLQKLTLIRDTVNALIAENGPDLPPPPPPPTGDRVTTSLELMRAAERGGRITVAPGLYTVNVELFKATELVEETAGTVLLRPEDGFRAALSVQSSDVTVTGFEVTNARDDRETVVVGNPDATDPLAQPNRVVFIGTKLFAGDQGGKRGWALHARAVELRHCEARNYWFKGFDSQALYINNGPGPFLIHGGYYEASGENILLGGASMLTGINPTGIIRGVTMRKPQEWRGLGFQIKNLLEIKSGVGITVEDCTLDGNWGPTQGGNAIVLTPRNQHGDSPMVQVDGVVIQRNTVKNCPEGFAVNVLGTDDANPSQPMRQLWIAGNLFADSPNGIQIGNAPELDVVIRRNTFAGIRGKFLSFYGPSIQRLSFLENVTRSGEYGIVSDDQVTVGVPALMKSVGTVEWVGNVIELTDQREIRFPAINQTVPFGGLSALLDENLKLKDGSAGW